LHEREGARPFDRTTGDWVPEDPREADLGRRGFCKCRPGARFQISDCFHLIAFILILATDRSRILPQVFKKETPHGFEERNTMTDVIGQPLAEDQHSVQSPMGRFARNAAILAGCAAFLAGLYFVFLYFLSAN
jgi:hypothetical protein